MISVGWNAEGPPKESTSVTPLGMVFLLLMGMFYVASMTSQSGLLLLLIGLFGAAFVVNYVVCRRSVKWLKVSAPGDVLVQAGEKSNEPWRVVNNGMRTAQMISVVSDAGELLRIAEIRAGESYSGLPEMIYKQRGVYPYENVAMTCVGPFGLLRSIKPAGVRGRAIVYPRLKMVEAPEVSGSEAVGGGKLRGKGRTMSGANFAGVRQWEAGDPLRSIHWKASATQGKLMVKIFDEELSGRLAVIVVFKGGDPGAEECIQVAGSIALAAMDEGHQVQFLVAGEERALTLMPFGDPHELLVKLAEIPNSPQTEADFKHEREVAISRRSAVCICATKLTTECMAFVCARKSEGKKVAVFLPDGEGSAGLEEGLVQRYKLEVENQE